MIELSKCPNCAEEDRVTIAGKEFCMRCGTPAEDNAKMGIVDQPAAAPAPDQQPNADQNQASGVSKFNSAPAGQPAQQPTEMPATATQAAPAQANQMPSIDQQKTDLENQINNLSAQSSPQDLNPTPAPTPRADAPAQQPAPVQTKPFTPPPGAVKKAVEQAAPPIMPEPATQPAAPVNIAIASSTPTPPEPQSNTQPVQGSMSLDKHTGVLSDDQFDQLRDSVAAPSVLGAPAAEQPTNAQPTQMPAPNDNTPATPQIRHNNDIYSAPTDATPAQDAVAAPELVASTAPAKVAKPDKKKKSLKPAGIAVSIIALFMVGAYVWKLNYSSLAFKVASSKAGLSASMPGYVPAGFNLSGDIRTNPGAVSYNLVNSSANKNITISQAKTDWDSQALAENYVAPKSENYLALQAQGLTVYVLGSNQATWVNKGTWYRLESSDKALTQDQIIKIATSL